MHHKLINLEQVEIKFADGKPGVFSGYASTFGGVDSYGDTVLPGAYKATLENRSRPVQMRFNHYSKVIGKWLTMHEDQKGLWVEGELTPGHSLAQDVYASLKHQAITGMSIGYRPVKSVPNDTGGLNLHEIDLVEISVVESPADLGAQVNGVKDMLEAALSLKEIETILRDAGGFSRSDATSLVARIKSVLHGERESEKRASIELAAKAIADAAARISNLK